ncbi:uncharacterized protein LOC129718766 [Wyeomyia smithii]|uniref:uncharacterized protein LOC129718766 n=1 Tax=Wyeomyia smithii TaxID=174621 RepID=UPI002467AC7B|nr:uncharacterized protein LOC129718766 [Wyeomyia smithii]
MSNGRFDTHDTDEIGYVAKATPRLDMGNGNSMFYVFADHVRVSEGATNILSAIQDLMCVQFVHSFVYIPKASKFLELLQEYFLKLFPAKGSKSRATRVGKQQRQVQRVIAALSNHRLHNEADPLH